MPNDCDNHAMVNDYDHHGDSEYDCDNHMQLASYLSFVTLPSYPCENDHKSITSFLTLNKNGSSCINVTLTTKNYIQEWSILLLL